MEYSRNVEKAATAIHNKSEGGMGNGEASRENGEGTRENAILCSGLPRYIYSIVYIKK